MSAAVFDTSVRILFIVCGTALALLIGVVFMIALLSSDGDLRYSAIVSVAVGVLMLCGAVVIVLVSIYAEIGYKKRDWD